MIHKVDAPTAKAGQCDTPGAAHCAGFTPACVCVPLRQARGKTERSERDTGCQPNTSIHGAITKKRDERLLVAWIGLRNCR